MHRGYMMNEEYTYKLMTTEKNRISSLTKAKKILHAILSCRRFHY